MSEQNRGGILLPILAGAVAGLIGWNVYQFFQIDKLRQEFSEGFYESLLRLHHFVDVFVSHGRLIKTR